jgi:hypothetical protein
VPAKVGTQEGSKVIVFAALGRNLARGLTIGIVRCTRQLTYAGPGLIALGCLCARPLAGAPHEPAHASSGDRSPFRV